MSEGEIVIAGTEHVDVLEDESHLCGVVSCDVAAGNCQMVHHHDRQAVHIELGDPVEKPLVEVLDRSKALLGALRVVLPVDVGDSDDESFAGDLHYELVKVN